MKTFSIESVNKYRNCISEIYSETVGIGFKRVAPNPIIVNHHVGEGLLPVLLKMHFLERHEQNRHMYRWRTENNITEHELEMILKNLSIYCHIANCKSYRKRKKNIENKSIKIISDFPKPDISKIGTNNMIIELIKRNAIKGTFTITI